VSFFLRQVGLQEGTEPLTSEFQIYSLSAQNSRVSICRDTKDFVHQQGRGKFQVSREKMVAAAHMDGAVILICDAEFLHPDSKISAMKENDNDNKPNVDMIAEANVRTANRELFESKLFADCKIQVDTKTFMAHRCILGQNSRVFRSMFSQTTMVEAQNGTVVIDGTRPEHFRALLEFVYGGSISANDMDNYAQGIMAIADKYEITPLKKHCEIHLSSKITDENVGELAVVADTYFATHLKKSCMRYLATHHKEIIRCAGWKELKRNRSQLVNELLESVLDGNIEDDEEDSLLNCSGESNSSAKKMRKF